MSTIYYTSSFDKVKDLIEMGYENFISIAGKTPDWFLEKIGKDSRFKKLNCIAPKYSWRKEWKDGKLTNEDYEKLYKETVLDKLDYKELKTSFGWNPVFLCYENSNEFCHRHLFAKWLKEEHKKFCGSDDENLVREIEIPNEFVYMIIGDCYGDTDVISVHKTMAGAKKEFEELKTSSIYDIKKFLKWFDPDTHHTFEIIPEHEFKYFLKEDGKFSTAFKLIKMELKN